MTATYLFGGTDVRSSVRGVGTYEGLFDPPDLVGDDMALSGVDGHAEVTDRTFGPGFFTLALILSATDLTTRTDAIRDLTRLVRPGRTVTVTRRRDYTTGSEDHTALCRYVGGLSPAMVGVSHARLAVVMKVLGGIWNGTATALTQLAAGTASRTVLGDARTRTMTITFGGATSGTVTLLNNTNGFSLSYTGATNVTPVIVDVAARTAMQGATDVSANLTWTKYVPFQLDEGSNSLTVSGGAGTRTVDITYTPAYL